mmetsp:Transcript_4144/g.13410  ORF Transcript_4144/g.13410 Transcript_4144/m.13410 type:complete len:202 (+) Transcript_4144:366-971(+)
MLSRTSCFTPARQKRDAPPAPTAAYTARMAAVDTPTAVAASRGLAIASRTGRTKTWPPKEKAATPRKSANPCAVGGSSSCGGSVGAPSAHRPHRPTAARPRQSTASAAIEMAAMPEKERWRTSGRRAAPVIRAYTSCEASRPREGRLESSVAACTWKETHTPNRTTSSEPSRRTTPPRPSARRTRSEYEPGASQSSSSQPV